MRRKNEQDRLADDNIPNPDEERIAQTILLGQKYMQLHIPKKTSYRSLLYEQMRYISAPLWLTQFLALILLVGLAVTLEPNEEMAQMILFHVAPLVALFAVPELVKDVFFRMSELESSCKNNSGTVLITRMIVVGCINICMLMLFAGIVAETWELSFFSLLMYGLVSFNCVNILNLLFLQVTKIRSRTSAIALSLLSIVLISILPAQSDLLKAISEPLWVGLLVGSVCVLTVQITARLKVTLKSEESMAWN